MTTDATVVLDGQKFQRVTRNDRTYWAWRRTEHWASEVHFDNTDDTVLEWRLLASALDRIVEVK